jgi:CBS domain-containing protein
MIVSHHTVFTGVGQFVKQNAQTLQTGVGSMENSTCQKGLRSLRHKETISYGGGLVLKDAVKEYMGREIAAVEGEATVSAAVDKMAHAKDYRGYVIVLEKGTPAGILAERDIIVQVLAKRLDPSRTKVSQVTSSPLVTVDPDTSAVEAAKILEKHSGKLAVVKDGIAYGIIEARDIAGLFREYVDNAIRQVLRFSPVLRF